MLRATREATGSSLAAEMVPRTLAEFWNSPSLGNDQSAVATCLVRSTSVVIFNFL